ncbi:coiled-coil domain-containing protein 141-like isoform X2 [Salvelinus fontinalis]|uniref:coiled-coil domain-containing protein 141-like isoform X2 n=1 Tax=Salvelinus fontinalis TaxID=8038 RepID=UPI002485D8B5|nr:coiled-coil domain-containing protein 141-like isoform X2 [Salvelinus fontinalis]
MSNESDTGGQPAATTTISTIAVQAGDSQIIVTVFKCESLVQLQLTEANPNLLAIGSNQDETKKLLHEHEQLLIKLKKHEAGVWALLEEADRTAEEKEDEGEVYEAMAVSLSDAWRTLISLLEKRRSLLHLASEFFDRALEFAIRIDEAEEFQSREQELADAECLKELLMKHSVMKRGLLEKSMLVLNKSRGLLDFLREFQTEDGLQRSEALRWADSSYGRVESLMEILQDRRRQVDQHMKQQLLDLEVILNIYQWDRQEQEVTHWFKNKADLYFEKDHLGSALTENEELLQEYKEFEEKAKDWSVLVEKLLAQASELQVGEAEGCAEDETGHVSERSVALKALHKHFWNLMMGRLAQLQESNSFFSSANTAFEVLGTVESKLKGLKTQTLWLPELAKKHEDLLRSIKESANDPLQRGQLILQKAKPQSSQVEGVKRMLGYVRDRVDALIQECHAHQARAAKRQQLVSQCEDLIDKISVWLKSSNGVLSSNTEPGSLLSQSEDMLNKHLELSSQTQQTASEAEAMAELLKELRTLGCPEAAEFSNKASLLEEELKTVTRNITSRIENIQPYVGFLRIAEEVEEQMQSLHESYNRKQEEEENEESLVTSKEIADAKWQSMLERFLTMLDLGNNYINYSNMVSENLNLNVRAAIGVVEKIMEELNKKKMDLSDLWTSWQLHVSQVKSVKKQWKKYKEQLKKTVHDLNSVEEVLVPTSKVDLGSDLQTVSKLLENFNLAKPHFLQLNAEVEYMVKTSELLALKGIPIKEKNEKVTEMLHLHQRVKDKIKEYESVLNMAVKFHQLYDELDKLSMLEPVTGFSETSQAKIQLIQHQDRQSHVRHLYKLAISLGGDISNTVQQLHDSGFSVQRLQERLARLERSCVNWSAEANRCEESLTSNVYYCVFKEEITELRKSFKDLKKKFNNLKFNYMKKNDESWNLKAVKNQIQQIEIYVEKLQILQKQMQVFTVKVTSSTERHLIGNSPREIEDAVNELQRQLGDFDKTVEEYKQNLDMSIRLQQAMDEYNFWCDEASATIVRVGKYSSQCKTREAVSILYKQFEKFVWPTVSQQEERISQITELAVRLHGAEEGNKYTEKTVTRHNELVESIKELSNGLMDLEAKLQTEALKHEPEIKELDNDIQEENKQEKKSNQEIGKAEMYPQESLDVSELKETGHTPELTMGLNGKEVPIKIIENTRSKKPQIRKTRSQELPDKLHPQHHNKVLSEQSRYHTQELCSETSRVETITSRLTMERKEQLSTSFSCTHTFNLSCSPLERDRKVHALNQAGIKSLVTPPPTIPPPPAFASAPSFSDIHREFQKKERQGPAQRNFPGFHTSNTDQGEPFPQDASLLLPPAGGLTEGNLQRHNLMTEESLSNDEYECTSPDDISLPPLSETPESNIVLSENDLDLDGFCLSSQSHTIHINQYSHQFHSTHNDYSNSQSQQRIREQTVSCPSPTVGLNTKFRAESSSFVHSPLTVPAPSLVSNILSNILKSRGIPNLPNSNLPNLPPVAPLGLNECHQTVYSVHESSVTEMQENVHDPSTMMVRGAAFPAAAAASTLNTHATPSPLTTTAVTLTDQGQDPDLCNPTAIREEIRLPGTSCSMGSTLAGQGPPHFSKLLSSPTIMERSPVTLEVEVTGFPEPTLTWFKNGEKLTNDEHIELSQKEGKHALFIQKVTEADAGLYVCRAVNSSGTLSSSAALQVNAGNNRCPDPNCPLLKLNWHTCFVTLCFLLYLLYLLLL